MKMKDSHLDNSLREEQMKVREDNRGDVCLTDDSTDEAESVVDETSDSEMR